MKDLEPWMANAVCPLCHTTGAIRRIVYGLPGKDLFNNTEIVLGGCCVTNNDPDFACKECGARCSVDEETGEVSLFMFGFDFITDENFPE